MAKAGKNRAELEKVISYCKKTGDPLKLKAIYFLISNMDIHYSVDYYWADGDNKKIAYNELDYPDFKLAVQAFNQLKSKIPKIHPVPVTYKDINSIKADFLIENVKSAFKVWKNGAAKNIPFKDFCEYILPYRVSVEPLQDWRSIYQKKFNFITEFSKKINIQAALPEVSSDYNSWFSSTWGKAQRKDPLPRLGALQLLARKEGPCEDIADLEVFTFRSQGIPVSLNIVPYWATSSSNHSINSVFDEKMHPIQFDVSRIPAFNNELQREPSKVLRITYSKQPSVLAQFEDAKHIPPGFMRDLNYIDITDQYWQTCNVEAQLFNAVVGNKVAYACVFNNLSWNAAWWGKVKKHSVTFNNMSKGVVYLPAFYQNGKIKAAGYPIAQGYHHTTVLKPDIANKRIITINEQDKYISFHPGYVYKLFYWDNAWKLSGKMKATFSTKSMLVPNQPKNALLLLVSDHPNGNERPFIITDNNQRQWF
ncbi:MAG: hypothetical protein ABIN91_23220 [Mucilaginibacter sp.]|uniref:hypothetical protein n=1 Tax=Mucilaginibacter sp. TaxID=1882438 RepID=UPI003266A9BD